MLDSEKMISLPAYIKVPVMLLVLAVLLVSTYVAYSYTGVDGKTDWIITALMCAQSAMLVFSIWVVVMFSERGVSIEQLRKKSDIFLVKVLPDALAKISDPEAGVPACAVSVGVESDIFGRNYCLSTNGKSVLNLWVGLNVHRLFCIYFVKCTDEKADDFVKKLKQIYAFTFGGAEKVGFTANYEPAAISIGEESERIISIWLTVEVEREFLTSPNLKLFWAQDIAMMTESFIRTSRRNNISFAETAPLPL